MHSGAVRRMREESVRRSSTDAGSHNTGTTTQAATSAPKILIQSDEEQKEETKDLPDYNLPEEREEKDGMIRSFLTGQMVPVEQANRRPIAIMMSNDKEARPQYGMNRAGVVYEHRWKRK